MMNETTGRPERRNISIKKHILILLCCTAIGLAWFSGGDIFDGPPVSGVSLEERYREIIEEDGKKIWSEQLEKLEKETARYIRQEMGMYRKAVLSNERLEAFCDEYYDYFKGIKFMFLGLFDVFSDKKHIENEIRTMVQENLLYDTETFAISLKSGIAEYVRSNVHEYAAKMDKLLNKSFTTEERSYLAKNIRTNDFKIRAAHLHTLGVYGGTALILNSQIAQSIVQKIVELITSKLVSLSSGMVTNVLTIGLGFLLDYLFSQSIRYFQEDQLKRSLTTSMSHFLDTLEEHLHLDVSRQIHSLSAP